MGRARHHGRRKLDSMSISSAEIETIVSVVLKRLQSMTAAPIVTQDSGSAAEDAHLLQLSCSLVTLESLRDRLSDISVVQVPKHAVVTPAVVDELRSRGISLQKIDSTASDSCVSASPLLVISPPGRQIDQGDSSIVQVQSNRCPDEARLLARHVAVQNGRGIWWTIHPYSAALACRSKQEIRAVQLLRPEDLGRAIDQANPNVLILDDQNWSSGNITNVLGAWLGSTE